MVTVRKSDLDAELVTRTIGFLDAAYALDLGMNARLQASLLPQFDDYDLVCYAAALWAGAHDGLMVSQAYANEERSIRVLLVSVRDRVVCTIHVPTEPVDERGVYDIDGVEPDSDDTLGTHRSVF